MYHFLFGLNSSIDEVWGRILGSKPLPSLDEIFVDVHREEHRRSVMLGTNSSLPSSETTVMAARFNKSKVWEDNILLDMGVIGWVSRFFHVLSTRNATTNFLILKPQPT